MVLRRRPIHILPFQRSPRCAGMAKPQPAQMMRRSTSLQGSAGENSENQEGTKPPAHVYNAILGFIDLPLAEPGTGFPIFQCIGGGALALTETGCSLVGCL